MTEGNARFPATPREQLEALLVGVDDIIGRDELLRRLERSYQTGKPLVVKLGADPSAPDIHLGHTVVLQKLRQFQQFGHEIVFLIGDFTGRIGDPTGKKKTRPVLTEADVAANAETYKAQIGKLLDLERTRIVFNSEWLAPLSFADVLKLSAQYTVARMLERDDFSQRFASHTPISIVEFMYPLMQGYDSVALRADVELGGTDQRFNLLVGRDLQQSYGQPPQVVVILPLLEGLDGREKMSKSLGNYVGINEPPDQMFGKLMSMPDELMIKYFSLLTDITPARLAGLPQEIATRPRQIKVELARTLTAKYHGEAAGASAEAEFEKRFGKSGDGLPSQLETVSVAAADPAGIPLVKVLTLAGFAPSASEARRLVQQGGVRLDQVKADDPQRVLAVGSTTVVQCGKRQAKKIQVVLG